MSLRHQIETIQRHRRVRVKVDGIVGPVTAAAVYAALSSEPAFDQPVAEVPLRTRIRDIQRHVGVEDDEIFGPVTAAAVLRELMDADGDVGAPEEPSGEDAGAPNARTTRVLATLDPKARPGFLRFALRAEAVAAAMGCDYLAISGLRTWKEQDALYAQGRTTGGRIVTDARAGYSWHNFGVAADFGVFRGGRYLDADDPGLASRVHGACAAHAGSCGLEWGGDWKRFQDLPHYQLAGLSSSPTAMDRKLYQEDGTIL